MDDIEGANVSIGRGIAPPGSGSKSPGSIVSRLGAGSIGCDGSRPITPEQTTRCVWGARWGDTHEYRSSVNRSQAGPDAAATSPLHTTRHSPERHERGGFRHVGGPHFPVRVRVRWQRQGQLSASGAAAGVSGSDSGRRRSLDRESIRSEGHSDLGWRRRQVMARTSSKSSRAVDACSRFTARAWARSLRWVSTSFAEA